MEKAFNMRRWMREQLDEPRLLSVMDNMMKSDFVTVGDLCFQNKAHIVRRDFNSLLREVTDSPLFEVGQNIRAREDMHDKFWRYLELFATVSEQATFQQNDTDASGSSAS